ncbi:urease subunit gamma [Rhodococcus sp. NPDC003382]|jgi:urease subunit gamma|uniref:urease subunit gamma n=1 Tax=Rhodococcus TaxID=1827 RepID=UPI00083629D1|nr:MULTISPECIES: urease subunit gamma [Rhodococcus]MBH0120708.1 urease subunit gamma [Rhodococcus sp. CX]MCK8675527.1 urease subunit gamma [Rhodococcus sp. HM1]
MHLTPSEQEKLLLAVAGMVARDRHARGVKLNYPETTALLTNWVIERARDGLSVAELMVAGREVLTRDDVMDGVAEMLPDVQVEATFPDGRKLVTIHQPIA